MAAILQSSSRVTSTTLYSAFRSAGVASPRFASSVPKLLSLKERLAELIPVEREKVKQIRAENDHKTFGPVLVNQLYG